MVLSAAVLSCCTDGKYTVVEYTLRGAAVGHQQPPPLSTGIPLSTLRMWSWAFLTTAVVVVLVHKRSSETQVLRISIFTGNSVVQGLHNIVAITV